MKCKLRARQPVAAGLYRVDCSIPADADFGTYTLLVKAEYYNARGTNTKAFQISQTLKATTATITQIENERAIQRFWNSLLLQSDANTQAL